MATRDRRRFAQVGGATTIPQAAGNTDIYVIAPCNGKLSEVLFSGVDALAANDTNFITWTIVNLGQSGAGSAAMLTGGNVNTTRATGGSALAANTKRALSVSSVPADITVQQGDRIRIRAAGSGTLANAVNGAAYLLTFQRSL
jgi:hypothetical protein